MILFQDTAEKKESPDLLSSAEYQTIKPCEHMSKEAALKFWDDKFAVIPEIHDMHTIDAEILLTEIFGKYEDEFQFDFELDDEIRSVLDCFDSAKWEKSSDGEKRSAIDKLATMIGEKLGLDKNPVFQFYDGSNGSYGAYLPGKNPIEINSNTCSDAMLEIYVE